MHVKTIVTGPFQANTYLLWQDGGSRAVIIDPGDEADRLERDISTENLSLGVILITHAHLDHICAVEELRRWSNAVVCLPMAERPALGWLPESCRFFGLPEKSAPHIDYWLNPELRDLSEVLLPDQLGGLEIAVHSTPGHSPGSVCYQIGNHWFVGDTLFNNSVGRVDLPGGDWPTLQASLRTLISLPDDTLIYPGHGPITTIGQEKSTNPFLKNILQPDTANVGK
ncbi:MAG: MBL fold metallo-hydrolase [Fidelibacterota bacterium]|nr:MAG: MBL fold metallo-hydrolase [Candidatus Neomarinimicrobiota bacterium]